MLRLRELQLKLNFRENDKLLSVSPVGLHATYTRCSLTEAKAQGTKAGRGASIMKVDQGVGGGIRSYAP